MEKEKWKDDILNSLSGLKQAEPNPFLFTRIEGKLEQAIGLTKLQVRLAGALMILFLAINIWGMRAQSNSASQSNTTSLTVTYTY